MSSASLFDYIDLILSQTNCRGRCIIWRWRRNGWIWWIWGESWRGLSGGGGSSSGGCSGNRNSLLIEHDNEGLVGGYIVFESELVNRSIVFILSNDKKL